MSAAARERIDENPTETRRLVARCKRGERVELRERTDMLQAAIDTLPDYQRMMIVMYHTENKSYEEISEILDLPIGTVKSRLNRARLSLREKLEPVREHFHL